MSGVAGAVNGGSVGNAGASTGGASAGTAGASAGSGAVGTSETEACMAYAAASCRRYDECSGLTSTEPYPCSSSCPDLMFAPGSTRTVEGLLSCAETHPTRPCEDVLAGRYPACAPAGTRQVGEPCMFATQCQTLACKRSGNGCGTCARIVAENADCTAPDAACDTGFLCTSGICRRQSTTIKDFGEPCESFADCDQINGRCNEQGICERYPGENESCRAFNKCTSAFYCDDADWICRPSPGEGEPCVSDAASGPACGAGLLCTNTGFPVSGTCVTPSMVDVGGDCTSRTTFCVAGATCTCLDPSACTEKRCTRPRLIGETCSDMEPCDP